ncbi:MAG: hypothetical protein SX243_17305 [Acidobacteriota bacterium]|nr:hypothetical protein [Acidobacteriota bacterium]
MSEATGQTTAMPKAPERAPRRLLIAAAFILVGLLLEAVTMGMNNAAGFLLFLGGGGLFTAVGIILYFREVLSGGS